MSLTQWDEEVRQAIINQCGLQPLPIELILNPLKCQIHADCSARVADEWTREHKVEATLDRIGDVGNAMTNPIFLMILVVLIVVIIGAGAAMGVKKKVGG